MVNFFETEGKTERALRPKEIDENMMNVYTLSVLRY